MKSFNQYLKEADEKKEGVIASKIILGDGNKFEPFIVSDDQRSEYNGKNANLAPLIRAFKEGALWGWSKDNKTGEEKPVKITGKKLYMIGGSVRDHLLKKTPRNIDLVTDASPDEIFRILKQNGFSYVENTFDVKKNKYFFVKNKDAKDKPFRFGVVVKNETFNLSVLNKSSKISNPANVGEIAPGNLQDDVTGRDFTINALAIPLTNDNGPNKELIDYYGGMHHLMNGKISPIGDFKTKLEEDPVRGIRFARMLSRYGTDNEIPEQYKDLIQNISSENLAKIDKDKAREEFLVGLNYDDCDSKKYLNICSNLGLLKLIFPGLNLNMMLPKEMSEIGDKFAPIAWMLKDEDPSNIESTMKSNNWKEHDLKKIIFLIKSLGLDSSIEPEILQDLMLGYLSSSLSGKKFKSWITKIAGKSDKTADDFLNFVYSPKS